MPRRLIALGLLALASACEVTANLGALPENESAEGESSDTALATDTETRESGESEFGSDSTTSESESDTGVDNETSSETETDADTEPAETGEGPCDLSEGASLCQICLAELCCEALVGCAADDGCACMVDCVNEGGDPPACAQQCVPGLAYFELLQCELTLCNSACL